MFNYRLAYWRRKGFKFENKHITLQIVLKFGWNFIFRILCFFSNYGLD